MTPPCPFRKKKSCARYGYIDEWTEHPNWFLRYDFVVKRVVAALEDSAEGAALENMHVRGHPDQERRHPMMFYTEALPDPPDAPPNANPNPRERLTKWLSLSRRAPRAGRAPFIFMGFAYYESPRSKHVVYRSDLVAAFKTLVSNWEDLYNVAISVMETYNLGRTEVS